MGAAVETALSVVLIDLSVVLRSACVTSARCCGQVVCSLSQVPR